jgi:hypothetical protein
MKKRNHMNMTSISAVMLQHYFGGGLIHVVWNDEDHDEGLVDLATNKVLCFSYGKRFEFVCDASIPTFHLTDADFDEGDERTWDEVPRVVAKKINAGQWSGSIKVDAPLPALAPETFASVRATGTLSQANSEQGPIGPG